MKHCIFTYQILSVFIIGLISSCEEQEDSGSCEININYTSSSRGVLYTVTNDELEGINSESIKNYLTNYSDFNSLPEEEKSDIDLFQTCVNIFEVDGHIINSKLFEFWAFKFKDEACYFRDLAEEDNQWAQKYFESNVEPFREKQVYIFLDWMSYLKENHDNDYVNQLYNSLPEDLKDYVNDNFGS